MDEHIRGTCCRELVDRADVDFGIFSNGPSGVHILQLDLLFGPVLDVARVRIV